MTSPARPDGFSEWKEVVRRGSKTAITLLSSQQVKNGRENEEAVDEKNIKEKSPGKAGQNKPRSIPSLNLPLLHQPEKKGPILPRLEAFPLLPLRLCYLLTPQKNSFSKGDAICQINRQFLERDLSSQWKALLRPLFTPVDFPSTEDPKNIPEVLEVITLIRNSVGGNTCLLSRTLFQDGIG